MPYYHRCVELPIEGQTWVNIRSGNEVTVVKVDPTECTSENGQMWRQKHGKYCKPKWCTVGWFIEHHRFKSL